MTDGTARLRALVEQWRERSRLAGKFGERNPTAAQDLKDGAQAMWYAFDECADELDAALLRLGAETMNENEKHDQDVGARMQTGTPTDSLTAPTNEVVLCGALSGWMTCDRPKGHDGNHRGYNGQIDEPMFWRQ